MLAGCFVREPYETLLGQYRDHWALWPFLEGDIPDWGGMARGDVLQYLSSGETVMIGVALAFWNGNRDVTVADLLRVLDEKNRRRVVLALASTVVSTTLDGLAVKALAEEAGE